MAHPSVLPADSLLLVRGVFSQCCEVGGFWGSAEEGWGLCFLAAGKRKRICQLWRGLFVLLGNSTDHLGAWLFL